MRKVVIVLDLALQHLRVHHLPLVQVHSLMPKAALHWAWLEGIRLAEKVVVQIRLSLRGLDFAFIVFFNHRRRRFTISSRFVDTPMLSQVVRA